MPTPITDIDRERIADRERNEALIDLRAMRDQLRSLIARGGCWPEHELKAMKRRRAALDYAIQCITSKGQHDDG